MKKLIIFIALFFIPVLAFGDVVLYDPQVDTMTVYKGRNAPYKLRLSYEGDILTEAEIEAFTNVRVLYDDTEYMDDTTCDACFDFGTIETDFADEGMIRVDLGSVAWTAGTDTAAELIAYDATYTNGRVIGTFKMIVSDDALAGASLVDPLTSNYQFQTIASVGQTNVVADTATDTLTLTAGAGITITTTPSSDTVTITSTLVGTDDQMATEVATSTTAFDNNLSAADTTVQAALETLDELVAGGAGSTDPDDLDGDTVNDNLVDVAIMPTAAPSNNDITHVTTADHVYDWVIGRGYLTAEVDGNVTNEIEVVDEAYSAANFNGGTTSAVSQDDFYDYQHIADTDDDGYPNYIDSAAAGFVKSSAAGLLSIDTNTYLTAEVDGSVSNEINTITGDDSDTTSGLSITLSGAGNVTTSVAGNVVTINGTAGSYTAGDFLTLTGSDIDVDYATTVTNGDTTHLPTGDAVYDFATSNFLKRDNTTEFTPDADNEPATKKYVDDNEVDTDTDDQAADEVPITDQYGIYTGTDAEAVFDELGQWEEIPSSVTGEFYQFGTTEVTLGWSAAKGNRITEYHVFQADYPGSFGTVYDFATSSTQYTVTGLTLGNDYQFKVKSSDGVDESGDSSTIIVHVTGDFEEEDHASEHAVGGDDTVFPADPDADKVLAWDDDTNSFVFQDDAEGTEYTFGTGLSEAAGHVVNTVEDTDTDDQNATEVPVTTSAFGGIFTNNASFDSVQEIVDFLDDYSYGTVYTFGTGLSEAAGHVVNTVTDTTLTDEQVQDKVGAMVTGNTETGITVTYQDDDGTLDFELDSDLVDIADRSTTEAYAFGSVTIGANGVRATGDGDGAVTLLGLGDGSDEDLTLNFDDTANTVSASSSTGVTSIDLGTAIAVKTIDAVYNFATSGDCTVTDTMARRGTLTDRSTTGNCDFILPNNDAEMTLHIIIVDGTDTISLVPPTNECFMRDGEWQDANDEIDLSSTEGDKFVLVRRYSTAKTDFVWDCETVRGTASDGGAGD